MNALGHGCSFPFSSSDFSLLYLSLSSRFGIYTFLLHPFTPLPQVCCLTRAPGQPRSLFSCCKQVHGLLSLPDFIQCIWQSVWGLGRDILGAMSETGGQERPNQLLDWCLTMGHVLLGLSLPSFTLLCPPAPSAKSTA